jgi:uncharacterized damage-inducible protein DinB
MLFDVGDILRYNRKANTLVILAYLNGGEQVPLIERQLSHIVLTHRLWLQRLGEATFTGHPWDALESGELIPLDTENQDLTWNAMGRRMPAERIAYTNMAGVPLQNTVAEILFNIVNHSSYHRGQVALMMREAGLEPAPTDFAFQAR